MGFRIGKVLEENLMRIYNRGIIDKDLMFVVGKVVEIFFDIM